jgi:hypothetical protein
MRRYPVFRVPTMVVLLAEIVGLGTMKYSVFFMQKHIQLSDKS